MHVSGFVSIVGRPNVGKSTLLNRLVGEKLAIVSRKPQTTRNRILGITTRPEYQLAFLDTPGVHKAKGELHRQMVDTALGTISEVDVVLFVIEAVLRPDKQVDIGEGNQLILENLRQSNKPAFLAINKIDTLAEKHLLLPIIDTYRHAYAFEEVFPISAYQGDGVAELERALVAHLPEGPALFPEDMLTDQAERSLVSELIREQVLNHCREEVPYFTAVVVDHFDEAEREPNRPVTPGQLGGLVRIDATILVERESQKGIVIGKGGQMLKKIGSAARAQIEKFLGTHVYLSLLVKVEKRWSERQETLRNLGYFRS